VATLLAPELDIARWAQLCKALGDEHRLQMLAYVASGVVGCCGDGVCACDLESVTGLAQPTVSHHMKILASVGLVHAEKRGRWMYYTLNTSNLASVQAMLEHFYCSPRKTETEKSCHSPTP
jgi:ArsR family transcriptional regulator, arsenate/arsenite/antimonite-responsive transcriptional repressor